jgi:FkbM family methyltransferase
LRFARAYRRLPHFRGKVRAILALYRAFGLQGRHIVLEADLWRPARYRARLDLHSWLERLAFFSGGYEEETVRFLMRLRPDGGYLLDVGANVGLITIPFLALSKRSSEAGGAKDMAPKVVAVEAVRANWTTLTHNIRLNGFERDARALCAALGDSDRTVEIQVEGDLKEGEGTGTANIMAADSTYECERIPLSLTTVDRLLDSGDLPRNCGLVKLDTDGYDFFVLKGAETLLREIRPVIFGEFSAYCLAWHHQDVQQVSAFAARREYMTWKRVSPDGWRFAPLRDDESFVQDLLLVPKEQLERVAWCRAEGSGRSQ